MPPYWRLQLRTVIRDCMMQMAAWAKTRSAARHAVIRTHIPGLRKPINERNKSSELKLFASMSWHTLRLRCLPTQKANNVNNPTDWTRSFQVRQPRSLMESQFGRSAVKNNLYLLRVVYKSVNYMFRPVHWPSSGYTLTCYKANHTIYNVTVK